MIQRLDRKFQDHNSKIKKSLQDQSSELKEQIQDHSVVVKKIGNELTALKKQKAQSKPLQAQGYNPPLNRPSYQNPIPPYQNRFANGASPANTNPNTNRAIVPQNNMAQD